MAESADMEAALACVYDKYEFVMQIILLWDGRSWNAVQSFINL